MARASVATCVAEKPRNIGVAALTAGLSPWARRNSSGEFGALVPRLDDGEIGHRVGIGGGQGVLPGLERLGGTQLPEALGNLRHLQIDALGEEGAAADALDRGAAKAVLRLELSQLDTDSAGTIGRDAESRPRILQRHRARGPRQDDIGLGTVELRL